MITLDDVPQGSEAWHKHRNSCWNASDIPAMMGVSPYTSRSDFMRRIATGIAQEHDDQTMAIFSEGHRSESLARPLMEKIIGQRLFPVVGYTEEFGFSRPLSASFDGLSMDESIGGEHKSLNNEIRRVFASGEPLPELYTVQMEVQCMVSSAVKMLFMASKWDEDNLVDEEHCWYVPDQVLRERIIQSIRQFEKDLENYQHIEHAEKPKAESILNLPALSVQATGMVTYSNLPEFKAAAESYIANINTDLQTDQQFADAEATVKFCKSTEETLEVTKKAILAQTATIDEVIRTVDHIQAQLRDKRLMLDKLVKSEKEARKNKMVAYTNELFTAHLNELQAEINKIRLNMLIQSPRFSDAIKGLKSLESMHDALDTALAQGKIEADAIAKDVRAKLAWLVPAYKGYELLFHDLQSLVSKPTDDFQLAVTSRIEGQKKAEAAKMEAERARMQAEEEAKAKAAQEALLVAERVKIEAEVRAKAARQAAIQAETDHADAKLSREVELARQEREAAEAIEERRKQAQIADQLKPVKVVRPSDKEIIAAISEKFGVSTGKACDWIFEVAEAMKQAA